MNLDPMLWGPSAWGLLHYVSFQSKSSTEELRDLFEDLKVLLPCAKCRRNFTAHLAACPFPSQRRAIPKWLYTIHDRVNRSIQSPGMNDTPPYHEVQETWRGTQGTERANRDSWRFLFLLARAYPPPQDPERRAHYRPALTRWMKEISRTLWDVEPRDATLESKTRFTQWLKNKYQAIHGTQPPTYLTRAGAGAENGNGKCSKVCAAPN